MSIRERPDLVPAAPAWRCPHCRTLQPEASRCRACARAAVTCASCRLYRPSFVADLGFCADDRSRQPLSGDEVRSCWRAGTGTIASDGFFASLESPPPPPVRAVVEPKMNVSAHEDRDDADTMPHAGGRLVEAPLVAPGRQLMSEARRRSRRH